MNTIISSPSLILIRSPTYHAALCHIAITDRHHGVQLEIEHDNNRKNIITYYNDDNHHDNNKMILCGHFHGQSLIMS